MIFLSGLRIDLQQLIIMDAVEKNVYFCNNKAGRIPFGYETIAAMQIYGESICLLI